MKVINIILASIIIYLGVGSTCFAQENDKALLERVGIPFNPDRLEYG